MEPLHIQESEFTPGIKFELNGEFLISGVSRPEDVIKFYDIPYQWLKTFDKNILSHANYKYKINTIHFDFRMKYMNSASAKCILQMLDVIKQYSEKGYIVKIDWYYDEADDQMLEDGEDLSEAIEIPFEFIPITE